MKKQIPLLKLTVRDQTDNELIIDIDGDIGWDYESSKKAIRDQLKEISNKKVGKIIVNISSLGGFVDDGLAIHDMLASHKAEVTTNVIGFTASAATIIAQAGNVRKISDNALYLIHKSIWLAIGNENDVEQTLKDMKVIDERLASIYAKRSGTNIKDIKELMNQNDGWGVWLSAEEALNYKLVDEVYEPMQAAAAVDMDMINMIGLPIPEINKDSKTNLKTDEMDDFTPDQKSWLQNAFNKIGDAIKGISKVPMNPIDSDKKYFIEGEIDELVGKKAFTADQKTPLEDGQYDIQDDKKITVAGGVITAVEEPEPENAELEQIKAENEALKAENERLNQENQSRDAKILEIEKTMNEMKQMVFGEPPEPPKKQVAHSAQPELFTDWYKELHKN